MTACAVSPVYESDPQAKLISRLRAGEETAFAELVRSASGRMLATARRLLPNEEDARDAVQDAFLAAFRALPSFQGQARLATWLHRIVINAALMKLRTRRRRPEASLEELLPHFDEQGGWLDGDAAAAPAADARVESRESRELVQRCIAQLPEAYRTVLILRDIEELDVLPTARALGISTCAVKTRLHRARQALRTLLQREMSSANHEGAEGTWVPTR